MSSVLVNFRLGPDRPVRLEWLAPDGVPGDGYKAQVTAVRLGGAVLAMDASAILEHTASDPAGGLGGYLLTFTGMVGFAADHPDRAHVEVITDEPIAYDLAFVREDSGRLAVEGEDYRILERPPAMAHRITGRGPSHA